MTSTDGPRRGSHLADFHMAALWAGLTAFVWYAFGSIPLHIAVARQLGLSVAQSSSWIFIIWFTGAISSIVLSLYYRQPIPITWTVPGLVYLGTLSGQYGFDEMVGGSLMAGVVIFLLAVLGVGERLIAWLPLPVVLGMFAGSILGYISRLVGATVQDAAIAGPTVLGYLIGRMIGKQNVPPMGLAVVFGAVSVYIAQGGEAPPIVWTLPTIAMPAMKFTTSGFVAISIPLVVFAMGMGHAQGLGFLISQGYKAPVNVVSYHVGICSLANSLLGGHPATVARMGVAILASNDAGPPQSRYWANLIAAGLTFIIAFGAGTVTALINVLPKSYAVALAGLAVLSTFQDALVRAFSGALRFGGLVAFAVAITPFVLLGINSAFWAILAGVAASILVEREELLAYWQSGVPAGG